MLKNLLVALAALISDPTLAAVEVNKATRAELESVTGLGPAAAGMILDERRNGPFKDWGDLVGRVKGVGAGNAAKLSAEGLTVGGASYQAATPKTDGKGGKAGKAATDVKPKAADAAAPTATK